MIAAGVRLKGVRIVSGGRTRAILDATRLKHRFNVMLSLPQSRTEAILAECLAERGVAVERGRRVTEIAPGASGARSLSDRRVQRVGHGLLQAHRPPLGPRHRERFVTEGRPHRGDVSLMSVLLRFLTLSAD